MKETILAQTPLLSIAKIVTGVFVASKTVKSAITLAPRIPAS